MRLRLVVPLVLVLAVFAASCGNNPNPTGPEALSAPSVVRPLLPAGAVLDSAYLMLSVRVVSDAQVSVHRATGEWEEASVTWNSFAAAYDSMASASFKPLDTGWISINVTKLAQGWIDQIYPNFGLALVQDSAIGKQSCFASRESGPIAPMLKLYCTTGDSTLMEAVVAVADAPLCEAFPDSNYAADQSLCAGWSDSAIAEIQSLIRFEIEIEVDPGCTRSKGYWKNHAGFGPQDDVVTDLLPQTLGSGGGKSIMVDSARQAVDFLSQKVYGHPSNGITKLYAQLLAAKLNIEDGASADDISGVIDDADAFLVDHEWQDWDSLDKDAQKQVLMWKDQLDAYNNGHIGPGHCDDDDGDDDLVE